MKETNRDSRGFVNWNYSHGPKNMVEVEKKLEYILERHSDEKLAALSTGKQHVNQMHQ